VSIRVYPWLIWVFSTDAEAGNGAGHFAWDSAELRLSNLPGIDQNNRH
jgi:hypothetical protein